MSVTTALASYVVESRLEDIPDDCRKITTHRPANEKLIELLWRIDTVDDAGDIVKTVPV